MKYDMKMIKMLRNEIYTYSEPRQCVFPITLFPLQILNFRNILSLKNDTNT